MNTDINSYDMIDAQPTVYKYWFSRKLLGISVLCSILFLWILTWEIAIQWFGMSSLKGPFFDWTFVLFGLAMSFSVGPTFVGYSYFCKLTKQTLTFRGPFRRHAPTTIAVDEIEEFILEQIPERYFRSCIKLRGNDLVEMVIAYKKYPGFMKALQSVKGDIRFVITDGTLKEISPAYLKELEQAVGKLVVRQRP